LLDQDLFPSRVGFALNKPIDYFCMLSMTSLIGKCRSSLCIFKNFGKWLPVSPVAKT